MLTVAYCRVSTEEQAAEGFSIEGQAEKLRAYATLHDLGDLILLADQFGNANVGDPRNAVHLHQLGNSGRHGRPVSFRVHAATMHVALAGLDGAHGNTSE